MRRVFLFLACFAWGLATSRAGIELTPTLTESTVEGITLRQLVFKDGKRQVTYELPPQWTYRMSGNSIKLTPPKSATADVVIQAIPLAAPQPFDDQGIAAAHEHFILEMPPTVQSTSVIGEQLNTVPVKAANCEITASYQALGELYMRRALYVNLPDTQLIFRLTARKNEFESLWRTFRASILSWQWVDSAEAVAHKEPTQSGIARQ